MQAGVLLRFAARRPGDGVPVAVSPVGSPWPDRGDTVSPRERGDGAWRGRCGEREPVLSARAAPWRLATLGTQAV